MLEQPRSAWPDNARLLPVKTYRELWGLAPEQPGTPLPQPVEDYLRSLDLGPKAHVPSHREIRVWGSLYMAEHIHALPFWRRTIIGWLL